MDYQKLIQQLKQCEGEKLTAYLCTEGFWTIGIGRNLETNGLSDAECHMIFGEILTPDVVIARLKTKKITPHQSETLFMNDLTKVEEACYRTIKMTGNDARRAVIINMAFQFGITGLLKFKKTIAFYESENYPDAAEELMDSKYARTDTPERAQLMHDQMLTGEWQ